MKRELDSVFLCAAWFQDCSINWAAWEAIGTLSAVVVALGIALRRNSDTAAKERVQAAACAGELAISTALLAKELMHAIALGSGTTNVVREGINREFAKTVLGMDSSSLDRAARDAKIFDRDFAVAIGSLIGYLRILRVHVQPYIDDPVKHRAGSLAEGLFGVSVDAAARLVFIHERAWRMAGISTDTPIPAEYEKLRTFIVERR